MSFTPANTIHSPQSGIHKNLSAIVCRHLDTDFRKPIADHTQRAFEQACQRWQALGCPPTTLDSACGTAESSRHFASGFDEHLIIGLDQSAKRLSNSCNQRLPENLLLLRCDCTDFWRLAEQAQWRFDSHYLLYPNPWPKAQHLQRRWHGHPAFSSLLTLSSRLELRTNWRIYAEEFAAALTLAGFAPVCANYKPETAITAFERKYQRSGHDLWRVKCELEKS